MWFQLSNKCWGSALCYGLSVAIFITTVAAQGGSICSSGQSSECQPPASGSVTCYRSFCVPCPGNKPLRAPVPFGENITCSPACSSPGTPEGQLNCLALISPGDIGTVYCFPLVGGNNQGYPDSNASILTSDGSLTPIVGVCAICPTGTVQDPASNECVTPGSDAPEPAADGDPPPTAPPATLTPSPAPDAPAPESSPPPQPPPPPAPAPSPPPPDSADPSPPPPFVILPPDTPAPSGATPPPPNTTDQPPASPPPSPVSDSPAPPSPPPSPFSLPPPSTSPPSLLGPPPPPGTQPPASPSPPPGAVSDGRFYTVQAGDICMNIWTRYGLSEQEFYSLNPGINCSNLQLGQQVQISDGGGSKSSFPVATIAGSIVGLLVLVAAGVIIFCCCGCYRRRKPQTKETDVEHVSEVSGTYSKYEKLSPAPYRFQDSQMRAFEYEELYQATQGFSMSNLLGKGGSGHVYKGTFENGAVLAVKKMVVTKDKAEAELVNEVQLIGKIHHRNLVSLHGYCIQNDQYLLLYDFMANGSLEDALFKEGYPVPLTWPMCMDIVIDTAKGLLYLHELCEFKIIHRDMKPANVLLDANMKAKVSDFGLAKQTHFNQTHVTTRVAGTFGYLAPEYATTYQLNEKSDVYSFGVLMLVVIMRQTPFQCMNSTGGSTPAQCAMEAAKEDRLADLISPSFVYQQSKEEAQRFFMIALHCVQPSQVDRPKMSDVERMLTGSVPIPPLPVLSEPVPVTMLPGFGALTDSGSYYGSSRTSS